MLSITFFFQAEDGIRYHCVTGVQTCALPISAVEVQGDARIGGSELARLERAHQLDAAARAVGFVTGSEEGGARLETEAAMNTGIQPFEAAPIRHSVPSTATTNASPGSNVRDRKSTRLNSSHTVISYAVFCLKKKKT